MAFIRFPFLSTNKLLDFWRAVKGGGAGVTRPVARIFPGEGGEKDAPQAKKIFSLTKLGLFFSGIWLFLLHCQCTL